MDERARDSILEVRDEAARRGVTAFFSLHRERSHLLRLGNNSVSLNTSEDLTRLDVQVLDGRKQSGYTLMGDIAGPQTVRAALDRAIAQTAVAVPKDYDPIAPAVERQTEEQPQYDPALEELDPAAKVKVYAQIMAAAGSGFNYSGAWSSGSTELFLAGTASPATAWHLGTDQHFTCVLKHPQQRWELAADQTGWRADQVTSQEAIDAFTALLPVYQRPAWQVEPGPYTIAFGPWAIAQILEMAVWAGFWGRGYEEKQGWTAGKSLGDRLLSEQVTVVDDSGDPLTFRFGFDGAGLARGVFPLVQAGTFAGLAYDLATAAKYGRRPTPHAGSWSLAMRPGSGPPALRDALAGQGRVLYIPALHYMHVPNRSKGTFTGSSRFGAVLIEDGQVTRPLYSCRITDAFARVFGHVETLGPRPVAVNLSNTYGRRQPEGASVPAYMVSSQVAVTDSAEAF